MRRTIVVFVLVSSLATVTFAQHNQLSAFFSQSPASSVSNDHGYGVGFDLMWTPRISTGIAVAMEDHLVSKCVGGILTPSRCSDVTLRTYPVDLSGRFHFLNDTRWKPYVGLGLRYVGAPNLTPAAMLVVGRSYSDHVDPQIVGGLDFHITPSFGVSAEAKGLLGNGQDYDPIFKISAGLIWRF